MTPLFCFLVFLVCCFPLFYSPVGIVRVLIVIRLSFVGVLSFFGRFWYSYILFLVYVGGLLVLLIYICLVSRNFPLSLGFDLLVGLLLLRLCSSLIRVREQGFGFLGHNSWRSGIRLVEGRGLSIFVFLVVLLLIMLLVVVRVSGAGSSISVSEKS